MCCDYRRSRCPRTSNCFLVLSCPVLAGASSLCLEGQRLSLFLLASVLQHVPHHIQGSLANTSKKCYSSNSFHDPTEVQQAYHGRRRVVSMGVEPTGQKDSGVKLQKSSRKKHQRLRWQEARFHPMPHNTKHEHPRLCWHRQGYRKGLKTKTSHDGTREESTHPLSFTLGESRLPAWRRGPRTHIPSLPPCYKEE